MHQLRPRPASKRDIFGVAPPPAEWKPEAWPDYAAPIVRMDADGRRDSVLATFGLVPRSRVPEGVRPYDTMNARSGTVGEKRTFSGLWTKGQLCLIPATAVYEPNYEAGPKSTRYRIWLPLASQPSESWACGGIGPTAPTRSPC